VDVVRRQHAFDDRHAKLGAHLPDDRPHPLAQLAAQTKVCDLNVENQCDGTQQCQSGRQPGQE
jgi:hypothetical protein